MSRQAIIDYWLEKADQDIASAQENFVAGRYVNVVRDAYFACFHAFSSVLLKSGKTFRKHKEARSALHRDFIRLEKIDPKWGKHYDWLYDNRQKADYRPLVEFESEQVKEIIEQSRASNLKESCPFDTVCFHAQQCAEKYLKALLVFRSIDFPKTHDIRLLMQRVPADVKLGFFIEEVIPLNSKVSLRYFDA